MSGVAYIETFVIMDSEFGIEDYKDGRPDEEHFMADKFRKREYKRFHMWRNGCGIGQAKTLQEARKKIHDYAVQIAREKLHNALTAADKANAALVALGTDPSYLFRFEHKEVAA